MRSSRCLGRKGLPTDENDGPFDVSTVGDTLYARPPSLPFLFRMDPPTRPPIDVDEALLRKERLRRRLAALWGF